MERKVGVTLPVPFESQVPSSNCRSVEYNNYLADKLLQRLKASAAAVNERQNILKDLVLQSSLSRMIVGDLDSHGEILKQTIINQTLEVASNSSSILFFSEPLQNLLQYQEAFTFPISTPPASLRKSSRDLGMGLRSSNVEGLGNRWKASLAKILSAVGTQSSPEPEHDATNFPLLLHCCLVLSMATYNLDLQIEGRGEGQGGGDGGGEGGLDAWRELQVTLRRSAEEVKVAAEAASRALVDDDGAALRRAWAQLLLAGKGGGRGVDVDAGAPPVPRSFDASHPPSSTSTSASASDPAPVSSWRDASSFVLDVLAALNLQVDAEHVVDHRTGGDEGGKIGTGHRAEVGNDKVIANISRTSFFTGEVDAMDRVRVLAAIAMRGSPTDPTHLHLHTPSTGSDNNPTMGEVLPAAISGRGGEGGGRGVDGAVMAATAAIDVMPVRSSRACALLVHDAQSGVAMLAFRGTRQVTDVLTDAAFLPTALEGPTCFRPSPSPPPPSASPVRAPRVDLEQDRYRGMEVHTGFLSALESVYEPLDAALHALPQNTTLIMTGHSMGGALAQLAAASWAHLRPHLVTIAAPATGNAAFCRLLNDHARPSGGVRLWNDFDVVPWVALLVGFEHAGVPLNTRVTEDAKDLFRTESTNTLPNTLDGLAPHILFQVGSMVYVFPVIGTDIGAETAALVPGKKDEGTVCVDDGNKDNYGDDADDGGGIVVDCASTGVSSSGEDSSGPAARGFAEESPAMIGLRTSDDAAGSEVVGDRRWDQMLNVQRWLRTGRRMITKRSINFFFPTMTDGEIVEGEG